MEEDGKYFFEGGRLAGVPEKKIWDPDSESFGRDACAGGKNRACHDRRSGRTVGSGDGCGPCLREMKDRRKGLFVYRVPAKKVITVGAMENGVHSGQGPTQECVVKPDLCAPGIQILSCNGFYPFQPSAYVKRAGPPWRLRWLRVRRRFYFRNSRKSEMWK